MQLSYTHIWNKQSWSLIRYYLKIFYKSDISAAWSELHLKIRKNCLTMIERDVIILHNNTRIHVSVTII